MMTCCSLVLLSADVTKLDHWLASAMVGAVLAALGFLAKQLIDLALQIQHQKKLRLASLVRIRSLLRASRVAFETQRDLADRLFNLIKPRLAPGVEDKGFEYSFASIAVEMTPEEKELHHLIRGITVHALSPVNVEIGQWLKQDAEFKSSRDSAGRETKLASLLSQLEAHLMLWNAKFQTWIPGQENHALIFMADEQNHGLGFPHEIDAAVEAELKTPEKSFIERQRDAS